MKEIAKVFYCSYAGAIIFLALVSYYRVLRGDELLRYSLGFFIGTTILCCVTAWGVMVRKPDVKKLQAEVDRWNETVPVGSKVVYVEIMGDRHGKEFVTRSAAQVLSGHTAVVWLAGKAGCVALNHCTVVDDQ